MSAPVNHLAKAIVWSGWCFAMSPGFAQSGIIARDLLPTPPPQIVELLQRADVQFTYGWDAKPASMRNFDGPRLDGITVYEWGYSFNYRNRPPIGSQRRSMTIDIDVSPSDLTCKHTVWFREVPDLQSFWSNPLVLHELDHVRISSDPRLKSLFLSQSQPPLIVELNRAAQVAPNAYAKIAAQDHVKAIHAEILALIDIRYQELDRLTRHGANALPADAPLAAILADATE